MVLVIRNEDQDAFVKDFITEQGLLDQYATTRKNLKRQGHLDELSKLSDVVAKAIKLAEHSNALFIDSRCRVYNGNGILVCVAAYGDDIPVMLELIKAEYHAFELD